MHCVLQDLEYSVPSAACGSEDVEQIHLRSNPSSGMFYGIRKGTAIYRSPLTRTNFSGPQVFMTRRDTLTCVHEPFGDAYYFGPERLSDRYENNEKGRIDSGFSDSTYRTILDRIEKENAQVRPIPPNAAARHTWSFHSFLDDDNEHLPIPVQAHVIHSARISVTNIVCGFNISPISDFATASHPIYILFIENI